MRSLLSLLASIMIMMLTFKTINSFLKCRQFSTSAEIYKKLLRVPMSRLKAAERPIPNPEVNMLEFSRLGLVEGDFLILNNNLF